MKNDRYARISAAVSYDGKHIFPWIQSGMRLMFRFDDMDKNCYLPNMGLETDGVIQAGASGHLLVDVIADEPAWPLLTEGQRFTLNAGPSDVVAHGVVTAVSFDIDRPLSRGDGE